MAEGDAARVEGEQSDVDGRVEGSRGDVVAGEPSRGLQDLSELVLGVDRRDQEGVARRGRKLGEAGGEGALEPGAQGKVRRPVAVPVGVAAHAWELHESQRVARRLLQDELTVGGAEVAGGLQEERTSGVVVEAEQLHLAELAALPPRDLVTAAERGRPRGPGPR